MRDQSKRNTRENYIETFHQKVPEPQSPKWDVEELDLTARYLNVEKYITENYRKHRRLSISINSFKLNRYE